MSEQPPGPAFELTPRQKRLRTLTLVILVAIVAMIVFASLHPFFHPVRPPVLTGRVRKALAVQGMFILAYLAVVFAMVLSLVIIAWLYAREIRVQFALAQRDLWKGIVEEQAQARASRKPRRTANRDGGRNGGGHRGERGGDTP